MDKEHIVAIHAELKVLFFYLFAFKQFLNFIPRQKQIICFLVTARIGQPAVTSAFVCQSLPMARLEIKSRVSKSCRLQNTVLSYTTLSTVMQMQFGP